MVARKRAEAIEKNETTVERSTDRELTVRRAFNGSARLVFDVWTKPELVKRWWAPRSRQVILVSCEGDVRVGGTYRCVFAHAQHGTMAFSGVYREVAPAKRLVHTEGFEPKGEGVEGEPAVITVTFTERDGKTYVEARMLYPSKEVLEMVVATGMEGGMRESWDQLDEVVTSMS